MPYTKKAVKRTESGDLYLDCECGEQVPLPYIQGMPMTYMCGACGISYDGRGVILERPEFDCINMTGKYAHPVSKQ